MTKLFYTLLICFLVASSAHAEEPEKVDCAIFGKEIINEITKPATCYRDEDCHTISWGCPFQTSPCHLSIYSDADNERYTQLSQKITRYENVCVKTDAETLARCEEFYKIAHNAECRILADLMCLNGECVTPVAGILQGLTKGEDIYGSREIITE